MISYILRLFIPSPFREFNVRFPASAVATVVRRHSGGTNCYSIASIVLLCSNTETSVPLHCKNTAINQRLIRTGLRAEGALRRNCRIEYFLTSIPLLYLEKFLCQNKIFLFQVTEKRFKFQ